MMMDSMQGEEHRDADFNDVVLPKALIAQLKVAFQLYDFDSDGFLSVSEFNAYLKALQAEERITHEHHLEALFGEFGIEVSSTGKISFQEFLKLYQVQGENEAKRDLEYIGLAIDMEESIDAGPFTASSTVQQEMTSLDAAIHQQLHQLKHVVSNTAPVKAVTSFEKPPSSSDALSDVDAAIQRRLQKFTPTALSEVFQVEPSPNKTQEELDKVVMALKIAAKEGVDLATWFQYFDPSGTGKMPAETFERALSGVGVEITKRSGALTTPLLTLETVSTVASYLTLPGEDVVDYFNFLQSKLNVVWPQPSQKSFTTSKTSKSKTTEPNTKTSMVSIPCKTSLPLQMSKAPSSSKPSKKRPTTGKLRFQAAQAAVSVNKKAKSATVSARFVVQAKKPNKITRKRVGPQVSSTFASSVTSEREALSAMMMHELPPELFMSIEQLEKFLKKLFKFSPEKYIRLWKGLELNQALECPDEQEVQGNVKFITLDALHQGFQGIQVTLQKSQVKQMIERMETKPWEDDRWNEALNKGLIASDDETEGFGSTTHSNEKVKYSPHKKQSSKSTVVSVSVSEEVLMPKKKASLILKSSDIQETSTLRVKESLLKEYLRHLRLNVLQTHNDWRKKKDTKEELERRDRKMKCEQALLGQKQHDLSMREMKNYLKESFQLKESVLKQEARRAAKDWVLLGPGKSLLFKRLMKTEPQRRRLDGKKLRREIQSQLMKERVEYILTHKKEQQAMVARLFTLYSRDVSEPTSLSLSAHHSSSTLASTLASSASSFPAWLDKRQVRLQEETKHVHEWKLTKRKQEKTIRRLSQDVAPTHLIHRQIQKLVSSVSIPRGLEMHHHLRELAEKSKNIVHETSEASSTLKAKADLIKADAWWTRLSSHGSRFATPLDGLGAVISREECLKAVGGLVRSLATEKSKVATELKYVLADPATIVNVFEKKLSTPRGQAQLHHTMQELKKASSSSGKPSDIQEDEKDVNVAKMTGSAKAILLERQLRGKLFWENDSQALQVASEDLKAKLQHVQEELKRWQIEKERGLHLKIKQAKAEAKAKKAREIERKAQAAQAYQKWKHDSQSKKYFSYSRQTYLARPVKAVSRRSQKWVSPLPPPPSEASKAAASSLETYMAQLRKLATTAT